MNNTSVSKYWKILFYPPNTDTGTFYGGSTDIDTDAKYPKCSTDIRGDIPLPIVYRCPSIPTIFKLYYSRWYSDMYQSRWLSTLYYTLPDITGGLLQVNLCQKVSFLNQLTHNMRDLSLNPPKKYKFRTCCVQILFWMSKQKNNFCTRYVFFRVRSPWVQRINYLLKVSIQIKTRK